MRDLYACQGAVYQLQRADGLRHVSDVGVELWSNCNDLHLLERSNEAAAGISHHRLGFCCSRDYQVPPRVDLVGPSWSFVYLG